MKGVFGGLELIYFLPPLRGPSPPVVRPEIGDRPSEFPGYQFADCGCSSDAIDDKPDVCASASGEARKMGPRDIQVDHELSDFFVFSWL